MARALRAPRRNVIATVIALLWAVTFGAARDVVWADLRAGLLTTKGLARTTRLLVWSGLALLVLMIAALLLSDTLRAWLPLHGLAGGAPGRGTLIPAPLLPVTLFVLGAGTAFMLVGALHLRPAFRAVALLPLLAVAGGWLSIVRGLSSGWQEWAVVGALVAIPVVFVARWRAEPRPVLEFTVFLALVTAVLALAQERLLHVDRLSGSTDFAFTQTSNVVLDLNTLVLPLLFMIGIDIAEFAQRTSAWGVTIVRDRMWRTAPAMALAGFAAWSMFIVGRDLVERLDADPARDVVGGYAGALAVPLAVAAVWFLCRRLASARRDGDDVAGPPGADEGVTIHSLADTGRRGGARLTVAYLGLPIVLMLGVLAAQVLFAFEWFVEAADLRTLLRWTSTVAGQANLWRVAIDVAAVVVGIGLARRGRANLAVYLAAVGVIDGWFQLTIPGRPLEQLAWRGHGPEEFWWTLIVVATAVAWLARRRLTALRVEALLFVLVLLELSRLTRFLDDPYSAVFPIGGAAFIAVGVAWDLGSAGSWANDTTPAVPRISRIFLYVGYVLFAVTLVNWSLASHDVGEVDVYTGGGALNGFELLGRPLLYVMFVAALVAAHFGRQVVAGAAGGSVPGPEDGGATPLGA